MSQMTGGTSALSDGSTMIVVVATTHIATESLQEFRTLVQEQVVLSRAEDGCVHYSCTESEEAEGTFHWIELWRDLDAFNAHAEVEHHQEYLRVLSDGDRIKRSAPADGRYFGAETIPVDELVARGFSPLAIPNTAPDRDPSDEKTR